MQGSGQPGQKQMLRVSVALWQLVALRHGALPVCYCLCAFAFTRVYASYFFHGRGVKIACMFQCASAIYIACAWVPRSAVSLQDCRVCYN